MQPIGTGNFANILLYRHMDANEQRDDERLEKFSCAFKFAKEPWEESQIINELTLLREIRDPENILKLFGSFTHSQKTVLVFERCQQSLQNLLDYGNLTEHQGRGVGRDIANGLTYLQKKGIVLCDLKPDNVLEYKENWWKVCDLGLSQRQGDHSLEYKGKLEYMAPESMQQLSYTCYSDWFSFGILLMEIAIHPEKIKELSPYPEKPEEFIEYLNFQNDEEKKTFIEETLRDYMNNLKTQKPDQRSIDDILQSTPKKLNLAYVSDISILIKEVSTNWKEEFLILAFAEIQDKATDRLHPKHIVRYQQAALDKMNREHGEVRHYRRCVPQCCIVQ
ncbi:hypothetical protein GCM10023116_30800 [Kistimonas scapharcae]|uniref:mitogen-activated protein kinase kinase n=2 Tax=Kistimonas scapharcae TaxID=1036133 RepID=A0ABP8V4R2_9GAMM